MRRIQRVQIMGVVNRTPDSFFAGGRHEDENAARARIDALVRDGAAIVDIGAESSRPGAAPVSDAEQIARLGDAVRYAASTGALVSIDTTSPRVAEEAIRQGARMINSVSLAPARELGRLAADTGAELVLTHCRGSMQRMPGFSEWSADDYDDVVSQVAEEWKQAAALALEQGLAPERLVFDPGLGFAKSAEQSLALCAGLGELKARVRPHRVLVGPGRKSYLARAVAGVRGGEPPPPSERLGGTLAASIDCVQRGADIVRVHDVAPLSQALAYLQAVAAFDDRREEGASTCSRA